MYICIYICIYVYTYLYICIYILYIDISRFCYRYIPPVFLMVLYHCDWELLNLACQKNSNKSPHFPSLVPTPQNPVSCAIIHCLVVSTHLKTIYHLGLLFPIYLRMLCSCSEHVPNHHRDLFRIVEIMSGNPQLNFSELLTCLFSKDSTNLGAESHGWR